MSESLFGLTSFQRDLLYVAAGREEPSGQEIKDDIESVYDAEITHGRLYPNLDSLAEHGFIDKGQINRRTNSYSVNEQGLNALVAHTEWQSKHIDRHSDPLSA